MSYRELTDEEKEVINGIMGRIKSQEDINFEGTHEGSMLIVFCLCAISITLVGLMTGYLIQNLWL